MNYTKHYQLEAAFAGGDANAGGTPAVEQSDPRDGRAYQPTPELELAVNLALATGRPLLLRGHPGSGKSSFPAYFARRHGWRYYEQVVTARTQARDVLYEVDTVRRLADATSGQDALKPFAAYLEPGALWWALDLASATRRGLDAPNPLVEEAKEPREAENRRRDVDRAVLLIDEIDKADPDFPNALLVPLGSAEFQVKELGIDITARKRAKAGAGEGAGATTSKDALSRLLVVVTTNEERELPRGFLRRCIVHELPDVDADRLVQIAGVHFGSAEAPLAGDKLALARKLADKVIELVKAARARKQREPSAGEYLDTLRACFTLGDANPEGGDGLMQDAALWPLIESATLLKPDRLRSTR